MPPDAKFPKLRLPVTIRFGEPITIDRYLGRAQDHLVLRQIIDDVMFAIRELSGQDYVNEYAAKKKSQTEAAPAPADGPVAVNGSSAPVNGSSAPASASNGSSIPGDESEFVKATDTRSSADVLKRPVRRKV